MGDRTRAEAAEQLLQEEAGTTDEEQLEGDDEDDDEEEEEDEEEALPAAAAPPSGGWDWPALIAGAEAHAQAGKFEKAINEYSELLRRSSIDGGTGSCPAARQRHHALLTARAAAFAALSQQLRSIPAAQSESRAIFAPDPTHLAGLGLKDAEAALALVPGTAEALLQRGHCLFLLERYDAAGQAYREGLQQQPTHEQLQQRLQELQAVLAEGGAGGSSGSDGGSGQCNGANAAPHCPRKLLHTVDDVECLLCFKLLYEPVTTACGHTFCKPCFARAMDHGNKCPMCRTVLHCGRELAVTVVLKNLLERSFPVEYARRREEEVLAASAPAGAAPLPLFVMSLLLPGERLALNIFEPRYRLMVRRCMEGNRLMGMATVNRQHELYEVATSGEIVECQPLPDGRYYIEVVGRQRFRPADVGEQDGYRIARPEFFEDELPPEAEAAQQLQQELAELEGMADSWLERLRALAQTRRGVAELLHRAGEKPAAGSSPEALSFYIGRLVCAVMDEGRLKQQVLSTRSTLERVRLLRHVLQQLVQQSQGCTLM